VKLTHGIKSKITASKKANAVSQGRKNREELKGGRKQEIITPNKVQKPKNYYAGVESLRGRKRKKLSSFKRRESLNKKGWNKDDSQMSIDKFLVPRKKKVESSQMKMMGCSDSFS